MTIVPTDASKNPSPQLRAIFRWLDALTVAHDVKALADVLTDDFTHQAAPKSLGLPVYDRAGFLEYAEKTLMPLLTEYNTSVLDVVENKDRVVVHASSIGVSSTGHTYTSEIIIITHVVEQPDGEYKIKSFKEFVDSKMVSAFYFAEVQRAEEAAKSSA